MRKITDSQTIRIWKNEADAAKAAAAMQAEDADWSYTVQANKTGFVVVIKDEDGNFLGCAA